ncbi:MAG: hypothetical protein LBC10_00345, partial [Deltaproteobacteria bacterium]|nr:hypothetical protein [Deltaproteobacteria bacterium]
LTGMRGTIEKKGEGKATIDIKAIAESEGDNYIIGMEKGTINLIGAGAADISIEASFSKTAGEVTGMQGGTITKEGAGVDTIDIKAIADCEYIHCGTIAHGMVEGASITMIGNDETTINIEAKGIGGNSDYCEAIGMQGSSITIIGDGGSTIGVTADINGKAAIGMQNSNITTGGGNDFIHIIGALDNSGIDTGGGNDEVWIENDIIGGSIDLGTGDDFLMLRGILSDGVDLQGGGNEEVVQALADGGMAHLGDILGLTSNNLDNLDVGSTTTIHGFEALLIELASDNQASLDDLLHGFDNLSIKQGIGYTGGHENDDNLLVSLVLTGNSDILDNLVRDNGTLLENAKQHSAVQIEGRPESDLYDHYVISYHDPVTNNDYNDINLYILKHA